MHSLASYCVYRWARIRCSPWTWPQRSAIMLLRISFITIILFEFIFQGLKFLALISGQFYARNWSAESDVAWTMRSKLVVESFFAHSYTGFQKIQHLRNYWFLRHGKQCTLQKQLIFDNVIDVKDQRPMHIFMTYFSNRWKDTSLKILYKIRILALKLSFRVKNKIFWKVLKLKQFSGRQIFAIFHRLSCIA